MIVPLVLMFVMVAKGELSDPALINPVAVILVKLPVTTLIELAVTFPLTVMAERLPSEVILFNVPAPNVPLKVPPVIVGQQNQQKLNITRK